VLAYYDRGRAFYYKGAHALAIIDFTEAILLASEDETELQARAYHARGCTYRKNGQEAEAKADWAEAARLGFSGEP
jgi:tetratricopeptide (TPR) repeat protein